MDSLVVEQDPPQMGLVPGEGAVQELAAASPDPALTISFMRGVATLQSTAPNPGVGEDRVERGGEVRAAIADHGPDSVRLLTEVHDQVAGLLGGPFPSWMQGGAQDADAPGGVFNYGQDVSLGAVKQVDREFVSSHREVTCAATFIFGPALPV